MDESLGRIIRKLKAQNQYDNTIFAFSSDNGGQTLFGANNFPFRGRKFSLWQGGIRSAGFIKGPGIPKGELLKKNQFLDIVGRLTVNVPLLHDL